MGRVSLLGSLFVGLSLVAAAANAQTPPPQAFWSFDDGTNPTADNSGYGHHGTLYGTPTYTTDVPAQIGTGKSLSFNGSNNYIALNMSFAGPGVLPQLTASVWFKTTFATGSDFDNWSFLDFDRSERFNFYVTPSGRIGFSTTDTRGSGTGLHDMFSSAASLNNGVWHHVAVVYDGSNKKIYVDGVLDSTAVNAHGGRALGSNVSVRWGFIGDGSEATNFDGARNNILYSGKMDEVAFWTTPLSASQISALAAGSLTNAPPTANAGDDFSVNEGQTGVTLLGSGSDPDNDPLTYLWEQVVDGSPPVTLSNPSAAQPTFTAPVVAEGGETLTFTLRVTAGGESATDEVSVTVVNVNHPPVAEAGDDQSVAEGSPVTLHGEASFDIDTDPFTYTWVQIDNGAPAVTLTGATTANPTFDAPYAGAGGAAGVVATLVFELRVDDGFSADVPASGYTLDNVVDTVTIEVTNVNNLPTAEAGAEQTVDENSAVTLDAGGSSDPDSDPLAFTWVQTGGDYVLSFDPHAAAPSFTAPFVSPGGADFTFQVTVDDGYGGTASDTVIVHVQNANDPPNAALARPTIASLWPPNHRMVAVGIIGVVDPDSNATLTIDAVTQDEPTMGLGDGDTAVDAVINADGTVLLRAERSGTGDGRVYHIHFTASDYEGSTTGVVTVRVPHSPKKPVVDGGPLYPSTQ